MVHQSASTGRSVSRENGVHVATVDLWGRHGEWAERRSVLIEGFRELRPDVVAFQEAITTGGYDQVGDLLGPAYHVAHQTLGLVGDGNDTAIASCASPPERHRRLPTYAPCNP
ncbi:MAG: hypothetical protein QOF73_3068 [Thermomicrobiales bacterium]|nr:hypothetical protein [Thermomicrobiales bacterium]